MMQDVRHDAIEALHQPPLPQGQHCWRCDAALDQLHGASFWRDKWWCLKCFLIGSER